MDRRRSIRLKGYDYSRRGAYFLSIVAYNRKCLFGQVLEGQMVPNPLGQIVRSCWDQLAVHYPQAEVDEFVVMPNHVHGIVVVRDAGRFRAGEIHEMPLHGVSLRVRRSRMLIPKLVGWFKMNTAKRINEVRRSAGVPVWQRN